MTSQSVLNIAGSMGSFGESRGGWISDSIFFRDNMLPTELASATWPWSITKNRLRWREHLVSRRFSIVLRTAFAQSRLSIGAKMIEQAIPVRLLIIIKQSSISRLVLLVGLGGWMPVVRAQLHHLIVAVYSFSVSWITFRGFPNTLYNF